MQLLDTINFKCPLGNEDMSISLLSDSLHAYIPELHSLREA